MQTAKEKGCILAKRDTSINDTLQPPAFRYSVRVASATGSFTIYKIEASTPASDTLTIRAILIVLKLSY